MLGDAGSTENEVQDIVEIRRARKARLERAVEKSRRRLGSPLHVGAAVKERVTLDAEEMFGNRRWVTDAAGRLVERRGPARAGDAEVVRTIH